MKKGGGKSKGSAFERKICQELSKWVSYDKRDDIFWRSAMSGGRATVGMKRGITRTSQAGDITAIDSSGQKLTNNFVIECKFYRNIHIESMMFGKPKNNSILEFWTKLYTDSLKLGKDMMLIIKQNNSSTLIALPVYSYLNSALKDYDNVKPVASFMNTNPGCYLYDFKKFLKEVDPIILKIN